MRMSSVSDEFRRSQLTVKALFFVRGFQYATWVLGHLPSRERVRPAWTGWPQQRN
jgi:hypothetical protein